MFAKIHQSNTSFAKKWIIKLLKIIDIFYWQQPQSCSIECTNKIFINAAASPATDGNIGDNDDEEWQMGCCYRSGAKLSEYRWLRPSLRLTSQSEAGIWVSWPIRGQHWVQPRSRSVTIFHSRDLSERHHNSRYTRAGREATTFWKGNLDPRKKLFNFSVEISFWHNNADVIYSSHTFYQKSSISTIHISGKYFLWKRFCPSETDSFWDLSDSI